MYKTILYKRRTNLGLSLYMSVVSDMLLI